MELRIVEDLHHAEAFALFHDVDIVVDQLNAGWYGLFAIESMALGKPVVTFLHEQAVARTREAYGVDVPILNATKDTLRARLEELLEMGPEGRRVIGAASREYVERVHDAEQVTDRMIDLYASIAETAAAPVTRPARPSAEPVDALDSVATHGRGGADRRTGCPAAPPRQPVRDLRARRARLANPRGHPAPDLHPLPDAVRLRPRRDPRRSHHRPDHPAPRWHPDRVLPLLVRRRRPRVAPPRAADVVLVHDGGLHGRARGRASPRRPDRRRRSSATPASPTSSVPRSSRCGRR